MSKSHLRPDLVWSVTLAATFTVWVLLPPVRIITSIALLLHLPVLALGIANLRFGFFCKAWCRAPGERQRLALTFDDGPEPLLTPAILDLLDEFNFKATFFVIARNAEKHPGIVREIVAQGHTVACHDLNHLVTSNFRRHRQMAADVSAACSIITTITGKQPRLYRPPVGLSNPHLRTVLSTLDMECIGWSRSLGDAGNRFVKSFARMPQLAKPGSVILLHDCLPHPAHRDRFLDGLRSLCEQMRINGLTSISVGTLFNIPEYR